MIPLIPVPRLSADEARHKALYEADVSVGHLQCTFMVPRDDGKLCCALRSGHPGMHCHGYKTPSPKEGWRGPFCMVCKSETRLLPCECGVVTCQDCGPCMPPRHITFGENG